MAESDEQLELRLTVTDQLSEAVAEADQNVQAAVESICDSWAEAAQASSPIGTAVTAAGEDVKTAVGGMTDAIGTIPEAAESAAESAASSLGKVGTAAHSAAGGLEHAGSKHSILQMLAHRSHDVHTGMRAMTQGAQAFGAEGEKLIHTVGGISSKLIGAVASGNLFIAGVTAASIAIGYLGAEEKKHEEEEKKRLKEIDDEVKKVEANAVSNAEKSAAERRTIAKSLTDAKITAIHVEDDAIATSYAQARAREALRHEEEMKTLEERKVKNAEVLAEANKSVEKAETDPQKKQAAAAQAAAQKAIAETSAAEAIERQVHALKEAEATNKRNVELAKEDLDIHNRSVQVLNRLADERRKGLTTLDQEVRQKLFSLGLDEKMRGHASELMRIEELRKQGLGSYADELAKILALQIGIAEQEKAVHLIEERMRRGKEMEKDIAIEMGERSSLMAKDKAGWSDRELRTLEEYYRIRDSILKMEEQGLDHQKALLLYKQKIAELEQAEAKRLAQQQEQYRQQTQDFKIRADRAAQDLQMEEKVATAHSRNDDAALFTLREENRLQQEYNEKYDVYLKFQREVNDAAREGDTDRVAALKEQYALEIKILETKHKETEEERIHNDLLAAGIKITASGMTATHADKGLRSSWQDRNIKNREDKLHRQAKSHGAQYGGRNVGDGDPAADNAYGAGGGGGDMDGSGGGGGVQYDADGTPYVITPRGKRPPKDLSAFVNGGKATAPDLADPGAPKAPGAVPVPQLGGDTGDATASLQSQLDAAIAKLGESRKQLDEMKGAFEKVGKHLEDSLDPMKVLGDSAKSAGDSAGKVATAVKDGANQVHDLAAKVSDLAKAAGPDLENLKSQVTKARQDLDALLKQFDDLKKLGG